MLPFVKAPLERGKGVEERTETKTKARQEPIRPVLLLILVQYDSGVRSTEVRLVQPYSK